MTTKEDRKVHRLTDKLGITSDGNLNLILMEWYELSAGVGKNAPKTGEFAWRPFNGGAHFGSIQSLARKLHNKAELEAVGEVGLDFDKFTTYLDKWQEDVFKHLNEHITLELAKVKDLSKKADEEKIEK